MTSLPILNNPFMIHPRPAVAEGVPFVVLGDGQVADAEPPAYGVSRGTKTAPFQQPLAFARSNAGRVVYATEEAQKTFVASDDRATMFRVAEPISGYSGKCERLHWVEEYGLFIGQSAKGSSHAVLTGSADGSNWQAAVPGDQYQKAHSGFAFSPKLRRAVVMLEGDGENTIVFNGAQWYPGITPDNGGNSVVWSAKLERFFTFDPDTLQIWQSVDGFNWLNYTYNVPASVGYAAGSFAAYTIPLENGGERILLFAKPTKTSEVSSAWFSDDGLATWTAAQGLENTGAVTRYVALNGNAVYVAFTAELNKGMISRDYGSTWERSDHLSGNACGVIALS